MFDYIRTHNIELGPGENVVLNFVCGYILAVFCRSCIVKCFRNSNTKKQLRLAPPVQRLSMPRSPLSKIKDQGGCERSVCFHQKWCESRRRAARGCTSCCFPIFVAAYFLHFRFSSWWLSIHNNFSTSAAICALGDYVGDRNRVTG